jgi:hypothetical protein
MLRSFDISLGSGSVRLVLNTIGIRLATSNTNPGHINPDFLRVNDLDPPSESPLSRLAIPFGDVHPRLFVRSSYQIEGNLVEVALSDDPRAGGEDAHFFRVNGWVTFRFPGRGSVGDAGPSREALAKLPTAVHQFYEVAAHLCTQYSDLGA